MRPIALALGVASCLVVMAPVVPGGSGHSLMAQAPAAVVLATDVEREQFLRTAKIIRSRSAGKGVTDTQRVTLSDGVITHDASVQTIDEERAVFEGTRGREIGFKDSWRFNVAAYRIDRLLGLYMTPTSVERRHRSKLASFTWWVDDVLMDETERYRGKHRAPDNDDWNQQMWLARIFDELVANVDRNLGNLLIDRQWNLWLIDHSRSFRMNRDLRTPANLTRADRQLLDRLRALDRASLEDAVGQHLSPGEIRAMLDRRDRIVEHFEKRGPPVLFDRRMRCC